MSQLRLLTLRTIADLGDGDLEKDFTSVLQNLVLDCLARPTIEKKRQVSIVFDLTPKVRQSGECDDVIVNVQVASKCPAKVVPEHVMRATANGGLRYNPASPENPDQRTLDFDKGEE